MLTHMTPEWTKIAVSIADFVLQKRQTSMVAAHSTNAIRVYNEWLHKSGITIQDVDLAVWAVKHVKNTLNMPLSTLKEVVEMDRKKYKL